MDPAADVMQGVTIFAIAFWILIFLAIILKTKRVMREPGGNPKCGIGLIIVLLATIVCYIGTIGMHLSQQWLLLTGVLIALPMSLIGATIAVLGMIDKHNNPDIHTGARATTFSIIFTMLMWGGLVAGFVAKMLADRGVTSLRPTTSGEVVKVSAFNYQVTLPGKPYVQLRADRVNPVASFAMLRAQPSSHTIVIAEQLGWGMLDLDTYQEVVTTNLKSVAPDCKFGEVELRTVDGIEGRSFHAYATVTGHKLYYEYWIGEHNGFAFQIISWGSRKEVAAVTEIATTMYDAFAIIDRDKIVEFEGHEPFGEYRSEASGFELSLSPRWTKWPAAELSEDAAESEIGALLAQAGAIIVEPLFHPGLTPTRDELRAKLGLDAPWGDETFKALSDTVEEARFTESVQGIGTFDYVVRIVYAEDRSIMIAAWVMSELDNLKEELDAAVDTFALQDPLPPLDAGKLNYSCREFMAERVNTMGLDRHSADKLAEAIPYFAYAAATFPDPAYANNAFSTLSDLERYEDGLAMIADLPAAEDELERLSWQGWFQLNLERRSDAKATYASMFKKFPDYINIEDAGLYVDLLIENDAGDEALAFMKGYVAQDNSLDAYDALMDLCIDLDKSDHGLELLEAAMKEREDADTFRVQHARMLVVAGMPQKAIEVADAALKDTPKHASLLYYKASAEADLRWYRRAKATLEVAIEFAPDDPAIRSLYQSVSGALGTGDTALLRTNIDPVAIPAKLQQRFDDARVTSDEFGAGYDFRLNLYQFTVGEQLRVSQYRRARILARSGVDRFSAITHSFSGSSEHCGVNYVRVHDADGTLISEVDRQSMYVTNDTDEDSMVTDEQTVNIPVPGLRPGVTVEWCITTLDKGSSDELPFTKRFLSSGLPVHTEAVAIVGDLDRVQYHSDVALTELDGGQAWILEQPEPYVWEGRQPPLEDFNAFVAFGDAKANWATLVSDYRTRIAPKLLGCDQTRDLAAAQGDADPVAASLQWMRSNLTYKAIEFGVRGVIPNTPEGTLANRWGDCKDQAVLLRQLLLERGVACELALVANGERLFDELPSLDQFDHMIVYLPDRHGGQFLDPTDSGADPGDPVPRGLAGGKALVLSEDRQSLTPIPDAANPRHIRCRRTLTVLPEERLRVIDTVTLQGVDANYMRSYLRENEKQNHKRFLEGTVARYVEHATLEKWEIEGLDGEGELSLSLDVVVANHCHRVEEQLIVRPPGLWDKLYLEESARQRRTPFVIRPEVKMEVDVELRLPEGYVGQPPESAEQTGEFLTWKRQSEGNAESLTWRVQGTRKSGQYPAEQHAAFVKETNAVVGSIQQSIALRKAAGN